MFIPSQKITVSINCSSDDALNFYAELREWAAPKLEALGGGSVVAAVATGCEVEPATAPA